MCGSNNELVKNSTEENEGFEALNFVSDSLVG